MRLTSFTDYALRLMIMIHEANGRLVTIEQVAARYKTSRANMMKVANELTKAGLLTGVRGRAGGLRLARPAEEISVGEIVRIMEPDFALVECFSTRNECVIAGYCRLPRALRRATDAFMAELNQTTLADVSIVGAVQPTVAIGSAEGA